MNHQNSNMIMQTPSVKTRLKYLAHIEMGQSPSSSEYSDEAKTPFLQGTAEFGDETPSPRIFCDVPNKLAMEGDILFSVRAPVGELNIGNQIYGIGRGLCAIRSNNKMEQRFVWWALHDAREQLRYVETGSTYAAVALEDVGNVRISNYKISTQRRIAAYLDRETAHIDSLIAAKERLFRLLAEKRQALITCAVTRGLDPEAKMKDSGVAWLGEVPEGWEVERTKWLFKERNERSEAGEEELLTVSHITGVTSRSEKNVYMFEAETTEGYKVAYPNDLVINTLWAWMGAMGISPLHGLVSPAYHVYILSERLDPGYVDAIARIPFFVAEVTRFSKGVWSSRLRLYPEGLYEVFYPVPPLQEQRSIVAFIKKETSKLDQLRTSTERTITLLKERRSALIAAAVTGKIEIPES